MCTRIYMYGLFACCLTSMPFMAQQNSSLVAFNIKRSTGEVTAEQFNNLVDPTMIKVGTSVL